MPVDFGAARPSLPPQFEELADSEADIVGESLAIVVPVPEKPYKAAVMTGLGRAITQVAKLLGLDLGEGEYTEDVDAMDPEMVRFLAVLSQAAEEYGAPLPVKLEDIRGDSELTAITAALMSLANDRDFRDFLAQVEPDEEAPTELPDMDMDMDGEMDVEVEEFDFATRMRPRMG
jgi:hypothetical protein|tara:strand:- start:65 stop:589 length:525 start_codon:yes stop_codon:yes gene_type:complete